MGKNILSMLTIGVGCVILYKCHQALNICLTRYLFYFYPIRVVLFLKLPLFV